MSVQDYLKKHEEYKAMYPNLFPDATQNTTESEDKGYIESEGVQALKQQLESHIGTKPADYSSLWQDQINALANDIVNRKDFQYDVNADALYNQYKDRYVNLGHNAMMDTMGQAAQLTGGYGNSYAQMAGQQAYQTYLQGLTDKIPELAQLAYDRYNQQGQDLYSKYGLLNTQEQNAYNSWLGNYNQWLTERDYLANRYDTERGYDYGVYRDAVADAQWKAQFDEQVRQFDLQNARAYGTGGGGGSGSGSKNLGAGYNHTLTLVETAASTESQKNAIANAAEKGYITKAGAKELSKLIGNTEYTK